MNKPKGPVDNTVALGPLLLQGMDIMSQSLGQLVSTADNIGEQAGLQNVYSVRRGRYMLGMILAIVALAISMLFVGYQLNSSGNQRADQLRIIESNQTCTVRVNNSGIVSADKAEALYKECVRDNTK